VRLDVLQPTGTSLSKSHMQWLIRPKSNFSLFEATKIAPPRSLGYLCWRS
jgi:hypothetical protein